MELLAVMDLLSDLLWSLAAVVSAGALVAAFAWALIWLWVRVR